jgi:hypothetical protein
MSNQRKEARQRRALARRLATELLAFEQGHDYKLPFGAADEINTLRKTLRLEANPCATGRDLVTLLSYQIPDDIKAVAGFPADLATRVQAESENFVSPKMYDPPIEVSEAIRIAREDAQEERFGPIDEARHVCTCSPAEYPVCAARICPNSTDWDDDPYDPGYP